MEIIVFERVTKPIVDKNLTKEICWNEEAIQVAQTSKFATLNFLGEGLNASISQGI